jgi:hypothetical protein
MQSMLSTKGSIVFYSPVKVKVKGKVLPQTENEDPEEE